MTDPIQENHRAMMNNLAAVLDEIFNGKAKQRRIFFTLLVGEFGKMEGGRINYISNGNREDMSASIRELLARWEGRYREEGTEQ
jgi:hypothetical protein